MESIVHFLLTLPPYLIYAAVFAIAFIENVFPPFPSDLMVVFAGSLIGLGRVGFTETLLLATVGSCAGFVVMYKVGDWFGDHILEQGRIKFIPVDAVRKVEAWFKQYGYWLIAANRFLSGTRAVVSFFAGMSELDFLRTTLLSFISSLAWNAILVTGGWYLGRHWRDIGFYLTSYSEIVTAILVIALIVVLVRYFTRKGEKEA